ncbi:hypothetical protein F0562_023764 [Nyssa sinensis]|uniref:Uncharacterized protein n=1 Tax=Nyssa sinensis TaxID=561372 RepID=A0A5J5BLN5_9ASTE|nr:hypothetical protein F0562_023764 [Nyssa sinensis]
MASRVLNPCNPVQGFAVQVSSSSNEECYQYGQGMVKCVIQSESRGVDQSVRNLGRIDRDFSNNDDEDGCRDEDPSEESNDSDDDDGPGDGDGD